MAGPQNTYGGLRRIVAGPSEKRPKGGFSVYCAGGCHKISYRNTAGKLPKVEFYRFPWRKYDDNRKARGSLPYNEQGQRGICGSPCGAIPGYAARTSWGTKGAPMQRTRPICQRYFRRAAYIRALRRTSAGMVTAEKAQSRRFKSMVTHTDDTARCYTDGSARGCTLFLSVTPGGLASTQVCIAKHAMNGCLPLRR
ncbi:uncharacterized protein LOC119187024 isoform X2 [Rhipicephalus microplus]|uniref:uncharacterized protein LOC119187024 isoform X2 n=1 Tax=Rhipicephalus microplus TaxID=6941 RepID=UPI003F6BA122